MPLIERWRRTASKVTRRQNCSLHGRYVGTCKRVGIGLLKKTPHKNLDMKNKALQDYVTLAYRLKYLKGATSHAEWTRRSKEIGCMLGGYKKWLYDDTRLPRKVVESSRHQAVRNHISAGPDRGWHDGNRLSRLPICGGQLEQQF